ncbi:phenylalanine--tRNA ligase subunit beta [Tepidibacillus sp. HK-1]|uniref:phenylalanine--tRNA ligase subunit beta n=1 Tax=Tepidibacillus sp. HK-1 TaxID=1883407 RepID=UPI000853D7E4|nr:phenylalanine--tRNA ligase subunit beta [Tepidibacillus sp. HK-1]GBF12436.1 phenylalanine--tRNA ligase beta subunit [Tepidibacillus sp. HK-1]
MRVSYQWLSQYVDIQDIDPYELAEKLTRSGVAVDLVEKSNPALEKVVIGYVVEREQHPNAEKLSLCKVDVGQGEPLQIICGAANVAQGQKVPVALVGATLPGDIKIKKAKLRGVDSEGMICSAKELGMNEKLLSKEKTEGILVLSDDAKIGEPIEPLLGFNDYILELDLTPNRSDCLNMIGVAYEVAAILDRNIKLPEINLENNIDQNHSVQIKIESPEACPHYAARLVKNVKISDSPQWMQNRLIAAGIRPINNVVDITNFVMLEYGQPLHAFDFEKLDQAKVVVRMAKPNEKIVTLDDQERELDEQMLLITDGVKPIAIAGVMGAANSEVTKNTTQILLESAYFKGFSIRSTSKKLGLRSEASMRFEKGVDPNRIYAALNRAAALLVEYAGGSIEGGITEEKLEQPTELMISLKPDRINQILGTELDVQEMVAIMKRLGFSVEEETSGLRVIIPTRRPDVTIEADLIEEIARIYGYDHIPTTLPIGEYIQGGLTKKQKLRRMIKNLLEVSGLQEVISYTFIGESQLDILQGLANQPRPISLAMPMSEERQFLRTQLLPQLLEIAKYNVNRRNHNIRIYEIGATFISNEIHLTELPSERWTVAGFMMGSLPIHWQSKEHNIDFYEVKGVLEHLFISLGLRNVEYQAVRAKGFHPGRTAEIKIGEKIIGYIGQIHPEVQTQYDLDECYGFELDLNTILELADIEIEYQPLPKYPAIQRDIAVVVDKNVESSSLMDTIYENGRELLEDLTLFDVYMSEQLGEDKKSIAFSLIYRSPERTLTDEEVAKRHGQILEQLKEKYHAELRK